VTNCGRKEVLFEERILAKVGDASITSTEFTNSYQAGASLLKDPVQPKQSFLNAMIQEELLAGMLKSDSSITSRPTVTKALRLLKQELLVEQMFKEEVHNKVLVSDDEIKTAILQSNLNIKAKYLLTRDAKFARQCLAHLDAGVEFDSLLNDPDTFEIQAHLDSTAFLKYGELEAPLNEILFKLNPQEYSEVIAVGDAYLILQNMALLKKIVSEGDILKYHDRFHKILMYQKRLAESRRFIKKFMDPLEIQVTGESFVFLVNTLYELYVNLPYEQNQSLKDQDGNIELPSQDVVSQLQEHGQDPAVRFTGGILTIKELLDQVLLKPFKIESNDKQTFAKELNSEIAIALRDYFLEQEALKRGYDQNPKIVNELQHWTERLLVQEYIGDTRSEITINEDEIIEQLGSPYMAGEARAKQAEQQLLNLKCKMILEHQIDSLKTLVEISIDEEKLAAIKVVLPSQKRSPDAYLFKLGLPYLRSAFPTPDPIWGIK